MRNFLITQKKITHKQTAFSLYGSVERTSQKKETLFSNVFLSTTSKNFSSSLFLRNTVLIPHNTDFISICMVSKRFLSLKSCTCKYDKTLTRPNEGYHTTKDIHNANNILGQWLMYLPFLRWMPFYCRSSAALELHPIPYSNCSTHLIPLFLLFAAEYKQISLCSSLVWAADNFHHRYSKMNSVV